MTDQEIEASVLETVRQVWDEGTHAVPLIWTYCTECGLDSTKQRCLGILTTGESLCAHHFALRRIDEMRRERDNAVKRQLANMRTNEPPKSWRQPLDVDSFARI